VAVMLPLAGVSMLGAEGGAFRDPAADLACFDAIRADLRPGIPLIELDCTINDAAFSERAVEVLLELLS
jgi:uncharacterized protein (UPF0261 family)